MPLEIKKTKDDLYLNEILICFEKYLEPNEKLSILEIGGAPGQYLAFMNRRFKYKISCLDFSDIGCKKTKENFSLLKINGEIHNADLFSKNLELPLFDIVYSLGFIEHFKDLNKIIELHLKFLKPNGILLIGVPNFLGINKFFLKHLAPNLLSKHNLNNMRITNWNNFEKKYDLKIIFKNYIGGFEPSMLCRCENRTIVNNILFLVVKCLHKLIGGHLKFIRKLNHQSWSGYVIGIYKKKFSG